jgi:hypothetical protein
MIRRAKISDLPELLRLSRTLQKDTPYADVPLDTQTFGKTLGQCISNAFGLALVAQHDHKLTGYMLAVASPLWFSRKRSATDLITYAQTPGDGYKMLRQFIAWAWSIPNVVEITIGQSSGIDIERTAKMYERAGLKRVGALYTASRPAATAEEAA